MIAPTWAAEAVAAALPNMTLTEESVSRHYEVPPFDTPDTFGSTWRITELLVTSVRAGDGPWTVSTFRGYGQKLKGDGTVDQRRRAFWVDLPMSAGLLLRPGTVT